MKRFDKIDPFTGSGGLALSKKAKVAAFNREAPFNSLPLLPPVHVELETKAVLKQAIAAGRALAELKGAGNLVPNQAVLVRTVGLQEAKLSSEIENIVTTNDELYRALADEGSRTDPATKEVLRYNDALWHGYSRLKEGRPLSTRLFEEMVQIIKQNSAGIRRTTGTRITKGGRTIYTPPEGESILRDKLANLEKFLYAEDGLDPLVKLAVLHYQFEAIHPFADGNGRTGRILNILYLVEAGLLEIPVLYLSRYIIENKNAYYEGLRRITEENAWEEWTLFMLRAVETTALTTCQRIQAIRALMQQTSQAVKDKLPKIYSKDLIEVLFSQPYCRIHFLEEAQI
ncbi:MAG: Fic family protein, partial [Armatimonadota bacterium]|nr:Fic family protein [Armatimonadota bacterium]